MTRRVMILLLILLAACKGKNIADTEVTTVKRGTFLEELTEQGSVQAVNSISITAPVISYRYGSLKIARIVDDGEEVRLQKGRLDRQPVSGQQKMASRGNGQKLGHSLDNPQDERCKPVVHVACC